MTKLVQKQVKELNQLKADKKFLAKLDVAERCRAQEAVLAQVEAYLADSTGVLLREIEQLVYSVGDGAERRLRVTPKGELAKLITTVEPIVVLDIVRSDFFQQLDCYNVLTLLSCLVFEDRPQQPVSFYNAYSKAYDGADDNIVWFEFLAAYAAQLGESSGYLRQIFEDMLNLDYVWLLDEFVRTGRYGSVEEDDDYLFEGNFLRSVNKLLNLLKEVKNVCYFAEGCDMVALLDAAMALLEKDWPAGVALHHTKVRS